MPSSPLTSAQIRAARALIRWSAADLAKASSVGVTTIRRAELTADKTSMTAAERLGYSASFGGRRRRLHRRERGRARRQTSQAKPQEARKVRRLKTILVTGGAGFVGSHACKALSRAGYLPVTFDNLERGHERAVKWGPLERGDLRNRQRPRAGIRSTPAVGRHALCRLCLCRRIDRRSGEVL